MFAAQDVPADGQLTSPLFQPFVDRFIAQTKKSNDWIQKLTFVSHVETLNSPYTLW
jgi:hypothetical protein